MEMDVDDEGDEGGGVWGVGARAGTRGRGESEGTRYTGSAEIEGNQRGMRGDGSVREIRTFTWPGVSRVL